MQQKQTTFRTSEGWKDASRDLPISEIGKFPPSSLESEKVVISALLTASAINLPEVVRVLTPESFYQSSMSVVYAAILALFHDGKQIDVVSVSEELKRMGKLEAVGGAYALSVLMDFYGAGYNTHAVYEHALSVHEYYLRRQLITACMEGAGSGYELSGDIFDQIGEVSQKVSRIGEMSNRDGVTVGDAAKEVVREYLEKKSNPDKVAAISTGFSDLDVLLSGGWKGGQLIIIGGRTAMGKTSVAIHFARRAALEGVPVLFFTAEMSHVEIAIKLINTESDIDTQRLYTGRLRESEEQHLLQSPQLLQKLPIRLYDAGYSNIDSIRTIARIAHAKGECGMIVIDYLQLIASPSNGRNSNREQEVARASRSAKLLANELNIPVLLLAQLSRETEKDKDKIPQLSHLRESGAIEQDADVVSFVYRKEYYLRQQVNDSLGAERDEYERQLMQAKGQGRLIVAKQRNGQTGHIYFQYSEGLTRIAGREGSVLPNQEMPF